MSENWKKFGDFDLEKFEQEIVDAFDSFRFGDFRILPTLKRDEHSEENAFSWNFDWECKIGEDGKSAVSRKDLTPEQAKIVDENAEKMGWNFVQVMKTRFPVPWDGCSFNLTTYKGHRSWEVMSVGYEENHITSFSENVSDNSKRRIVGVLQVKNSDIFISKVINNFLPLVDELLILDNNSTDDTLKIIEQEKKKSSKIHLKKILTINSGGRYLHSLCGTDTVVVRVDGDEIWNPEFAKYLRKALINFDFSKHEKINLVNTMFNVDGIDAEKMGASGKYGKNPVWYFGNILCWAQAIERLHGDGKILRPGTDPNAINIRPFDEEFPTQPGVLHFPFLCLSRKGRTDFRPGAEEFKSRAYLAKKDELKVINIESYDIQKELQEILKIKETEPRLRGIKETK